jgi:hypothetical protein
MWLQYGTLTVMMTIRLPGVRDLEMETSGPRGHTSCLGEVAPRGMHGRGRR